MSRKTILPDPLRPARTIEQHRAHALEQNPKNRDALEALYRNARTQGKRRNALHYLLRITFLTAESTAPVKDRRGNYHFLQGKPSYRAGCMHEIAKLYLELAEDEVRMDKRARERRRAILYAKRAMRVTKKFKLHNLYCMAGKTLVEALAEADRHVESREALNEIKHYAKKHGVSLELHTKPPLPMHRLKKQPE